MKINSDVLTRFLKGELNKEEQKKVEDWYNASAENQKTLEQLYYVLFLSDRLQVERSIDTEKALIDFKRRIHSGRNIQKSAGNNRRINLWKKWGVAAAFVGIIFFSAAVLLNISKQDSKPFIVSTSFGERAQVTLPDGTKVWLNACSNVEYTSSFFSKERKVNMHGEAYFDVEHIDKVPFIVESRGVETKVLGTKFNIRANKDESYMTTTLLEGSILIKTDKEEIKMIPDQQLKYDFDTQLALLEKPSSPQDYISWMENKIFFESSSFVEITKSLERHYNINFLFADEGLKKEHFTGEFQTSDNIYQILSVLQLTGKFTYTLDDRTVTLYPR